MKRTRLDLFYQFCKILESASANKNILPVYTRILLKLNTDSRTFGFLTNFGIKNNLIEVIDRKYTTGRFKANKSFGLTKRGREFIVSYRQVLEYINAE